MIDVALFRLPGFNAALIINFLAIFVAVGYFLFVAQSATRCLPASRRRRPLPPETRSVAR